MAYDDHVTRSIAFPVVNAVNSWAVIRMAALRYAKWNSKNRTAFWYGQNVALCYSKRQTFALGSHSGHS